MAEELKPGAYWVLLYNSWTTAERRPDGFWTAPGNEIEFRRDEIQEIGPAIPTPDELRELREKAGNWDIHVRECRKVGLTIEDAARILYEEAHP